MSSIEEFDYEPLDSIEQLIEYLGDKIIFTPHIVLVENLEAKN